MGSAFDDFLELRRSGQQPDFGESRRKVVFENEKGWKVLENYDHKGNIDFYEIVTAKGGCISIYSSLDKAMDTLNEDSFSCVECGSKKELEIDSIQLKCNVCRKKERQEMIKRMLGEEE